MSHFMRKLDDIPKKVNFKAPDGYFDSFQERLRKRLDTEKEPSYIKTFRLFRPYMYFAGFLIILGVFIRFGLHHLTGDYNNSIAGMQIEQDSPLYYEYELMSEDFIYNNIVNDSTEDSSFTGTYTDDDILAYLAEEEIEYTLEADI